MSTHRHIITVNRMTAAVFENDRDTLASIFADDLAFHVRGALPRAGDHTGVEGFLGVLGTVFELTDGDVKIEQLAMFADDTWATEWEHALFGRGGRTLDTRNMFVYRFEGDRIAEMWMINTELAGAEAFWD